MITKKVTYLLILDKDGFSLYPDKKGQISKQALAPGLISDLEIKDKEKIETSIATFIENAKIAPTHLAVVVSSSLIFEKDFENNEGLDDKEIQRFLDAVPFEEVASKVYKNDKTIKAIGVNKDLILAFIRPFEKRKFIIETVLPITLFEKDVHPSILLKKALSSKFESLITEKVQPLSPNSLIPNQPNLSDKKKKIIAITTFSLGLVFLLAVSVYFFLPQFRHLTR